MNVLSSVITRSGLARAGNSRARSALDPAARSWVVIAVICQRMTIALVAIFFGGAALQGDFMAWNKVLPRGYVAGDAVGNLIVSSQLPFAMLITVSGVLQLTPAIRQRWPVFHPFLMFLSFAQTLVPVAVLEL